MTSDDAWMLAIDAEDLEMLLKTARGILEADLMTPDLAEVVTHSAMGFPGGRAKLDALFDEYSGSAEG